MKLFNILLEAVNIFKKIKELSKIFVTKKLTVPNAEYIYN
jgi:hypothetical protein